MKLKVTELKKQLKTFDQKELIQLVADLYKHSKEVQTYLTVQFVGEEAVEQLLEDAKKKIRDEFFPDKGFGKLGLTKARKAITDFKKVTGDEVKTLELMVYFVELGVDFTNSFGDIDEKFYNTMIKVFDQVITLCFKHEEYYRAFTDRLEQIVEDTEGIGWGFHDELADLYYSLSADYDEPID